MDGAFGVATAAGRRTQGIGKFLHQQRLVAMQGVEAFEAALEVVGQLSGGQLHSGVILGARRYALRKPVGFQVNAGFGVADALEQANAF